MNQNDGQNKLGNNNPNQGVPNNQNGHLLMFLSMMLHMQLILMDLSKIV